MLFRSATMPVCCLLRPRRAGPFEDNDVHALSALAPHIRRALHIRARLAGAEWLTEAQAAALDSLAFGCLVLDRHGAVLSVNRAARDLTGRDDGLAIRNGLLRAAGVGEMSRLRALTLAAGQTASGRSLHPGGALAVARRRGRPLAVLVLPFRGGLDAPPGRQPAAIVFVTDPDARRQPANALLRNLFGLTLSEARVAVALLDGDSPETAAERLGRSAHTVRNQLKSVFAKTGTRRQAELVRLLMAGLAPLNGTNAAGPP